MVLRSATRKKRWFIYKKKIDNFSIFFYFRNLKAIPKGIVINVKLFNRFQWRVALGKYFELIFNNFDWYLKIILEYTRIIRKDRIFILL